MPAKWLLAREEAALSQVGGSPSPEGYRTECFATDVRNCSQAYLRNNGSLNLSMLTLEVSEDGLDPSGRIWEDAQ